MADKNKQRCPCARCRVRGLVGPVMLITVGAIFLVGEYTRFGIGDLWPVLLVVAGLMLFVQAAASTEGHTGP
jgi:hypothetical protein